MSGEDHVRNIIVENKNKFTLGAVFLIMAIIFSMLATRNIEPLWTIISMWGSIICSLQCFLYIDMRADEYHKRQATRKALKKNREDSI